jgi:malate dehydrogenase (oxaloacetate-decarboxylating)(NADP+)
MLVSDNLAVLKYSEWMCITMCNDSNSKLFSIMAGKPLKEQKIMFLGAGEAGTGIGQLIAMSLVDKYGIPKEEALQSCFYIDSKGLVCKSRTDLQEHKLPFAHDVPFQPNLLAAVKALK